MQTSNKNCPVNPHPELVDLDENPHIQVNQSRDTLWVHSLDGSTVGRFSKRFGMDVHNTVSDQLAGAPQCLHCTHRPGSHQDWISFCQLMKSHFDISVLENTIQFD